MKTQKILTAFFLMFIIFIIPIIIGASIFQVRVMPEIISREISCMQKHSLEQVFIRDHFFYFLEDEKKYSEKEIREFRKYFDFPSFNLFYFKDNHLIRHFYIITNQKEIKEGFYQVGFQIKNTLKKPSFCLYEIEVIRIYPIDFELKVIEEKVKRNLYSNRKAIIKTDLSELFKTHKNIVKPLIPESVFTFDSDIEALNELEFLGQFNKHFIFRFKLTNADNEKAREEDHIARAYFCYIDYNSKSNTSMVYLTIAAFSIYIK